MYSFEMVPDILVRIKTIFLAVLAAFAMITNPTPADTDTAKLVDSKQYIFNEAYAMGQGLCEYEGKYYTSGAISVWQDCSFTRIDPATGKVEMIKYNVLPQSFKALGCDHIGDFAIADGLIYAPVEDKKEQTPRVLLYDASTFEYTGRYFELDGSLLTDGIPWLTVDGEHRVLYTTQFHDAEYLLEYDLDTMALVRKLPLSETLHRNQGGEYYNGKVYINCDPQDTDQKTVYEVDPATGDVKLLFTRNISGFKCETEGLTVGTDSSGQLVFRVSDYDKTIAMFVRSYVLK